MKPPPGPRGGRWRNARRRTQDFAGFMDDLYQQYGEIVYHELPAMNCCAVFSSETAEEVLTTQEPVLRPFAAPPTYQLLTNDCLHTAHGQDHRRRRQVMITGYAENQASAQSDLIIGNVPELLDRVDPNREIDILAELDRFSWRCLLDRVFGRALRLHPDLGRNVLASMKQDILLSIVPFRSLVAKLPLPFNRRVRESLEALDRVAYPAIERARDPGHDGDDLVSHLVRAAGQGLVDWSYRSDEEIRDEAFAHLCAAIDAPVAALTWGAHYIADVPRVRQRVEEEVDAAIGNRTIEPADFHRLPYLHAVLKEVLRLEPPAYALLPRRALEDCVLGGYLVPEGTLVIVGTRVIHRRADYWENPDDFLPERWLTDEAQQGARCPAHGYIPFSLEPRGCRGADFARMMFVLATASLVQRYRIRPRPNESPTRANLGVGVQGSFRVTLEAR